MPFFPTTNEYSIFDNGLDLFQGFGLCDLNSIVANSNHAMHPKENDGISWRFSTRRVAHKKAMRECRGRPTLTHLRVNARTSGKGSDTIVVDFQRKRLIAPSSRK
jgi:hypothetical protein